LGGNGGDKQQIKYAEISKTIKKKPREDTRKYSQLNRGTRDNIMGSGSNNMRYEEWDSNGHAPICASKQWKKEKHLLSCTLNVYQKENIHSVEES